MEYTASIDKLMERQLSTSTVQSALRQALEGLSAATWLFLVQIACYFAHGTVAHRTALADAVICIGVLASTAGIYTGLRWCREGSVLRGSNCAAVSMIAVLFWTIQVFLRNIPLFM